MPGPLVGAVMLGAGVLLAAVSLWLARQLSPALQQRLPASFWAILWRVAVAVLATGILIAVYLRLWGTEGG